MSDNNIYNNNIAIKKSKKDKLWLCVENETITKTVLEQKNINQSNNDNLIMIYNYN